MVVLYYNRYNTSLIITITEVHEHTSLLSSLSLFWPLYCQSINLRPLITPFGIFKLC